MPDLDRYHERERHAHRLARRYGLAPHGVDLHATLPPERDAPAARALTVTWLDTPNRLVRAGLVVRMQVDALRAQARSSSHAGLLWHDGAGTRWLLRPNGGGRAVEYGLWLSATYPQDGVSLPPGAEGAEFVAAVEALVARAARRPVRFGDPRDATTR